MSVMQCTACGNFIDTDYDSEGCWEIKGKDYICQTCFEDSDYLAEDGDVKPELLSDSAKRERAMHDRGKMMAAMANT